MKEVPFHRGLHALGGDCHVWLEPDGSWGWSNAGLITGKGQALLVDTLFDVPMTRAMLDGMAEVTADRPIRTVFNTHSNGDHWYGNQLLGDTDIIATEATAAEMHDGGSVTPAALRDTPGRVGQFAREIFGPFDWSDLDFTYPTTTFDKEHTVDVGGTEVHLLRLGPAHTDGDAVAYVPSTKTIYAGDLLFIGGTPVIWAGPLENWVEACNTMLALDVETVVPGHGPVTDKQGIVAVRHYLEYVNEQARAMFAKGVPPEDAARQISLDQFSTWNEGGRIAQNVLAVYYELDPTLPRRERIAIFEQIAELEARHGAPTGAHQ
ncbi:MAG TPA: MBL fold metallo-hydrolase [Acidimicrobiales bacterium]|jgi:glyoxylase-like metal-dependent hydrolase (beta-lactamase superfamily II)|nr:MBL fold metallo-hydrolase [Acidimicrobiales bacterium]